MIRFTIALLASLFMAGLAHAQTSRGIVVGVDRSTMVWAGPDDIYPVVARVRWGDQVWLHGCLRQHAWCDISLADGLYRSRGWVPAAALFIPWNGQHYSLGTHGVWQQFAMSDFTLSIYWGTHYPHHVWYRDRNRFDRHDWRRDQWRWDRHEHRDTLDRETYRQRIIDERRRQATMETSGRDRDGLTPLQRQIQLQSQRAKDLQRQQDRQQDTMETSGRDRDGLTPLQRQIQLQSQRAEDLQSQQDRRQEEDPR